MSEPTKRPHIYQRRPYDPEHHCGKPKDRRPETIREKMDRGEARIAAIKAEFEGREATVVEMTKIKRISQRVLFYRIALEKVEKYGPDDRPCMLIKGQGTTHPGTGYCRLCCECKGKEDYHFENKFTYSPRKKKLRLKQIMDDMALANHDLMDMEPDLQMLRAKVKDFCAEKGDDLDPESIRSVAVLSEQIRKTVDSMQDKKFKTMMSMDVFSLINMKMGEAVEEFVKDPEILEKILGRWERIQVETGSKRNQALLAANKE